VLKDAFFVALIAMTLADFKHRRSEYGYLKVIFILILVLI